MRTRAKITAVALAALASLGAAGGWAMAGTKAARGSGSVARPVAPAVKPLSVRHPATKSVATVTGTESTESSTETTTETTSVEEPGDQNLPGGGHADPAGQNVNHEFNGVE